MILSGHIDNLSILHCLRHAHHDTSIQFLELNFLIWDDSVRTAVMELLRARRSMERVTVQGGSGRIGPIWTNVNHLILEQVILQEPLVVSDDLLQSLSLLSMSLSIPVATAVGTSLRHGPHLLRLDLTDSRFVDPEQGIQTIARGLQNNTSLQQLILADCNFVDEQIATIVRSLQGHASIQELDISFNKCRSLGVAALVDMIETTPSLKKLAMGFQAFGEAKRIELEPLLTTLASTALSSSETANLEGRGREGGGLLELELGGNSLRDGDVSFLVMMLCHHPSLQVLDLSQNRITDVGMQLLAQSMEQYKSLRRLGLDENRFTNRGIELFIQALQGGKRRSKNTTVEAIDVGEGFSTIEKLNYYLDLNWGGRRLLSATEHVPSGLWPMVLARVNQAKPALDFDRPIQALDVLFYFLRGPILLER